MVAGRKLYTTFMTQSKKRGMFSNPFFFHGRIRRLEYFFTFLIENVIFTTINLNTKPTYSIGILTVAMWFGIAQATKRCHDLGISGWCQLIPLSPIFLLFSAGQKHTNKYGPNPKSVDKEDL